MHKHPLFILSSGRGGSTWVQDVIAQANGLPTIFEPFQRELVDGAFEYAYAYIDPKEDNPGLRVFLDEIFCGKRSAMWCRYRMDRRHIWHGWQAFSSKERLKFQVRKQLELIENYFKYRSQPDANPLVKFIRGNLMIGWLREQYQSPMFILLRHPGAVIESKSRLKVWTSEYAVRRLYDEIAANAAALPGIRLPSLEGMRRESLFMLHWCIETKVGLMQAAQYDVPVIFYEHLVAKPETEWQRAVTALGLKCVPDDKLIRKPSQQALKVEENLSYNLEFLARWQQRLSQKLQNEMQDMLTLFELDTYTMQSIFPVCVNAHERGDGVSGKGAPC